MTHRSRKLVLATALIVGLTAVYTLSPIDLLPDFVPLIGWLDDAGGWVASLGAVAYTLLQLAREGLNPASPADRVVRAVAQRERPAAEDGYEPLTLEQIRAL
jgi:uncharacterized membrane protein YkvA (DUF1232 family)